MIAQPFESARPPAELPTARERIAALISDLEAEANEGAH